MGTRSAVRRVHDCPTDMNAETLAAETCGTHIFTYIQKWWANVTYDTGLIEDPRGIQAHQLRGCLYSDRNAHRLPTGVL